MFQKMLQGGSGSSGIKADFIAKDNIINIDPTIITGRRENNIFYSLPTLPYSSNFGWKVDLSKFNIIIIRINYLKNSGYGSDTHKLGLGNNIDGEGFITAKDIIVSDNEMFYAFDVSSYDSNYYLKFFFKTSQQNLEAQLSVKDIMLLDIK